MCMSSGPKAPKPVAPPPEPQDAKAPDLNATRRRGGNAAPIAGGTLLTSPSGVANNELPIAGGSLLGN